jgi:ketosteroid isomerase-like protein
MNDFQAIADRVEIEALRAEFTDASMMYDWDRFASLFTEDGAWLMPHIDVELVSRDEIRAGVERLRGLWAYFVQNAHPGTIQLDGDVAVGRAYIAEFGRFHDGRSNLNYSLYHDRYQRTPDGWKFAERCYEVRYVDNSPLPGEGSK